MKIFFLLSFMLIGAISAQAESGSGQESDIVTMASGAADPVIEGGVLGESSQGLFSRVHEAHQRFVKRSEG